jgi:hypothetical protein
MTVLSERDNSELGKHSQAPNKDGGSKNRFGLQRWFWALKIVLGSKDIVRHRR